MNLAACRGLDLHPEHRVWFRAIEVQFLPTALGSLHTARIPSRFNPAARGAAGFPVLYFSESHHVALPEVGALALTPSREVYLPNPARTWVILNVQVTLSAVADLTDADVQARLQTTAQELTGDWRGYEERNATTSVTQPTGAAPTQVLGETLYQVPGLEGFYALSAQWPIHRSLVVFPDKLQPGSSIVFTNPATGESHTVGPRRSRRKRPRAQ